MTQHTGPGSTPLGAEEQQDLIPSLATQAELNEWERENILEGRRWAFSEREFKSRDPVIEGYVRELHRRMFNSTWKWAGTYRNSEKNIGVPVDQIRERIGALLGNVKYWTTHATYRGDEIAIRLHHELALIHPFPNGNGRHARLMADVAAVKIGNGPFSWGSKEIVPPGATRESYLRALRAADNGDFGPLLKFSRS